MLFRSYPRWCRLTSHSTNDSAYQPLDGHPTSIVYLLSLVFFFLQSPKPNHPVGSACSRLPWLAAPPPPYRTYPPTLASPSLYSPTRPVILRRRQPQHAPAPEPVNPRTPLRLRLDRRIFNGSCSFRPRPRRRPRPWFARHALCAALLRCQRRQQLRGTRI